MKKILTIISLVFTLSSLAQEAKVTTSSPILKGLSENLALQSPSFEINAGLAVRHKEGFSIPRVTVGVNNLFKSGIGFYMTPEYRGGITFDEDGTNYYFRIPMRLSFEYGTIGLFLGADPINALAGKNWRKEMGIIYSDPSKLPVDFRLGLSSWVGATFGIGYRFPMAKD